MNGSGGEKWCGLILLLLLALAAVPAPVASAHVEKDSGRFRVEMGWGVEPPLAGDENFVQVEVADSAGASVAVPAGALSVEVSYAGTATTLPLVPAPEPGELRAELVPTRPGTYSFDVSGTLEGEALEASATCSEATFECVEDAAATEFPVADPSRAELAQRLLSESERVERATEEAESARQIALVALALSTLALAGVLSLVMRERRKSGRP